MILPLMTIAIAIYWRITKAKTDSPFDYYETGNYLRFAIHFDDPFREKMDLNFLKNYVEIGKEVYRFEEADGHGVFKKMSWGTESGDDEKRPKSGTGAIVSMKQLLEKENAAWAAPTSETITWFTWDNTKKWNTKTVVAKFKREQKPFSAYKSYNTITLTYNDGLQKETEELPGIYYSDPMTTHPITISTPRTMRAASVEPYAWVQTRAKWCLGTEEEVGECVRGDPSDWEAMANLLNQKYADGAIITFNKKKFSKQATIDGENNNREIESSSPFIIRDSHKHGYWNVLMIGGFGCTIIVVVFCVGIVFGVAINWGYTQKTALNQQRKRKKMRWLDDQNNDEV
eukprot:526755_1